MTYLRIITSVILNCRGNDTKVDSLMNTHNGEILVELMDRCNLVGADFSGADLIDVIIDQTIDTDKT